MVAFHLSLPSTLAKTTTLHPPCRHKPPPTSRRDSLVAFHLPPPSASTLSITNESSQLVGSFPSLHRRPRPKRSPTSHHDSLVAFDFPPPSTPAKTTSYDHRHHWHTVSSRPPPSLHLTRMTTSDTLILGGRPFFFVLSFLLLSYYSILLLYFCFSNY